MYYFDEHIVDPVSILWHFTRGFFCTKVLLVAFSYLHFRFVLFWRKIIGKKAVRKMLVILTPELIELFSMNLVKLGA